MKFIASLLVTWIAITAVFGTIVVALANNPRLGQAQTQLAVAQSTPTQQPTPTQTDTETQMQTPEQTPGRVIYSGRDDQPTVALTFDDGPDPYTTHPRYWLFFSNMAYMPRFLLSANRFRHTLISFNKSMQQER